MTGTKGRGGQFAGPNDGRMGPIPAHVPPDQLRQLVREVLADVIGKMPVRTGSPPAPAAPPSSVPRADPSDAGTPVPSGLASQPAPGGQEQSMQGRSGDRDESGMWIVRITTDEDLHAFVLRVLKLAGNPKLRGDLISGRARFRLAGTFGATAASSTAASSTAVSSTAASSPAAAATHEVEKGAVTERAVIAAAAAGARLVLGPRAVMTPLAKDKARALGVSIERPRGGLSDARAPTSTERPRGGLSDARAPVHTAKER
jgi:hypothetical protein